MKKIVSIARMVLKLLFRGGAGWALIAVSSLLATFMFFATNSDNSLVNELHLRIKYSLYAFTLLLNISLMYIASVSLRKDIDERRFHNISSAPVHRAQIWLGKFLGLLVFGIIVFLFTSVSLGISTSIFISKWESQGDKEELKQAFFRTYYVSLPILNNLDKEVDLEYAKRREFEEKKEEELLKSGHKHSEGGGHDHGDLEGGEWRGRRNLLDEIRKEKQIIAPNHTGEWDFAINRADVKNDFLLLRYKIYTNRRRAKVKGEWRVLSEDGGVVWSKKFVGYPFLSHDFKIPLSVIPKGDKVRLAFNEEGNAYIIFPVFHGGLKLLYDSGGIFKNYLYLTLFSILQMAILIAMSLCFASIFSFSVAVFVTMATYTTGLFSGFFANVLHDLSFHDESLGKTIFSLFLKVGLWISESTKAPPVNQMFSESISIPIEAFLKSWGFGFFIYMFIICTIGIIALTRKEIDRILQS